MHVREACDPRSCDDYGIAVLYNGRCPPGSAVMSICSFFFRPLIITALQDHVHMVPLQERPSWQRMSCSHSTHSTQKTGMHAGYIGVC